MYNLKFCRQCDLNIKKIMDKGKDEVLQYVGLVVEQISDMLS